MDNKKELLQKSQERIKQLVGEFENQQEFADYCGISKYSLSQYVNGTNAPGNVNAAKIAKKLSLNPLWVMGFDVPMRSRGEQSIDLEIFYQTRKKQAEIIADEFAPGLGFIVQAYNTFDANDRQELLEIAKIKMKKYEEKETSNESKSVG